jgi:hypothetical protein
MPKQRSPFAHPPGLQVGIPFATCHTGEEITRDRFEVPASGAPPVPSPADPAPPGLVPFSSGPDPSSEVRPAQAAKLESSSSPHHP